MVRGGGGGGAMILFGAGRSGKTSLGLFLLQPPRRQVSHFTSEGGGLMFRPSPNNIPASGSAVSACSGGEVRRLVSAACGDLPYRWILACSAVVVPPFS